MATFFEYWTISLVSLVATLVLYDVGVKRLMHSFLYVPNIAVVAAVMTQGQGLVADHLDLGIESLGKSIITDAYSSIPDLTCRNVS
jgi:hypothetical protein